MYDKCMNEFMIVGAQDNGRWPVYLENDPLRPEGTAIRPPGPAIGYVTSPQELKDLADKYKIATHQIDGDGLVEMEENSGLMPD
jgi:hypothetical protein